MTDTSNFVYIVDRYLEVSNVYSRRMSGDVHVEDDVSQKQRIQHLMSLLEQGVEKSVEHPVKLKVIEEGGESGQIVIPNREFIDNTKQRQNDVLHRLENMPSWARLPESFPRIKNLLGREGEEFLGSFPSPGYASDVLAELASLTVCPDVKLLAARDLVHMHAFELQLHLARVIAQAKLLSSDVVNINISLNVHQLHDLEKSGKLTEELIENSVPRDPAVLLEDLISITEESTSARTWLEENKPPILKRLVKENHFFLDSLDEALSLEESIKICNTLVLYGLVATYAAWYSCALERPEEIGYLRTNILFCTRILLDEERWQVCRDFAEIALNAMIELNKLEENASTNKGTGMLTANLFFSRIMCGENLQDIKQEISDWNVDELHERYHFLKYILLENYERAAALSNDLLNPDEITGLPNMCIQEIMEWPILKKFRDSEPGRKVIDLHK